MEDNSAIFEMLHFDQDLIDCFNRLRVSQQDAILWLIGHLDVLDRLDSGQVMTEAEEISWRERARELKDDILMTLVDYKKWRDQKRTEKSSPDGEQLHNS